MRKAILSILFLTTLYAQPAFEVASVRPSSAPRPMGPPWKENIQVTPNTVTMRSVSLKGCIRWAYHVFDFQITGPDWMNSTRFDIVAKSAGAVSTEELRKMMQALLAERFQLKVHQESKVHQAYVITVAKSGFKLHESAADGEMSIDPQKARMQVVVQKAGADEMVIILSTVLRTPVIDQTGLKGKYDVTIDVAKYLPDRKQGEAAEAGLDPVSIITQGLQEEMGLKLDAKKMPVEFLVVDHVEKVPVEN